MIRKIRGIAKLACEFIIEVANTMTKNKITHQEEGTRIAIEVLNPHSVRLEIYNLPREGSRRPKYKKEVKQEKYTLHTLINVAGEEK